MSIFEVLANVESLLGKSASVEVHASDPIFAELRNARVRLELTKTKNIAVDFVGNPIERVVIRRIGMVAKNDPSKSAKPVGSSKHTYIVPKIAIDLMSVLKDAASHVVWLTGPTQSGKDCLVHYVAAKMGMPVFQINCRGDMGSEVFFGEKTITVDPATKQNVISFQKGLVEQAMTCGLDSDGKESGPAGVLFITEAAAMPSHVAIGINRLLESDDARRTIVIDQDGGRTVRSHSGFRIVLAANTVGRGSTGLESSVYSAQTDALDISLLNRIAVCFRMGYDKRVESHILTEKLADDRLAGKLIEFRNAIRDHIKQGKLVSPFSTAHIVHICDMYRIFGDIGKAIYYVIFGFLMPEERSIYNEQAMAVFGTDLLSEHTDSEVDYM